MNAEHEASPKRAGDTDRAGLSGVTMGWLLRLVTGAPLVVGDPDSSRILGD